MFLHLILYHHFLVSIILHDHFIFAFFGFFYTSISSLYPIFSFLYSYCKYYLFLELVQIQLDKKQFFNHFEVFDYLSQLIKYHFYSFSIYLDYIKGVKKNIFFFRSQINSVKYKISKIIQSVIDIVGLSPSNQFSNGSFLMMKSFIRAEKYSSINLNKSLIVFFNFGQGYHIKKYVLNYSKLY